MSAVPANTTPCTVFTGLVVPQNHHRHAMLQVGGLHRTTTVFAVFFANLAGAAASPAIALAVSCYVWVLPELCRKMDSSAR